MFLEPTLAFLNTDSVWVCANLCWPPAYCYLCFLALRITSNPVRGLSWYTSEHGPHWAWLVSSEVLLISALLTFWVRFSAVGAVLCNVEHLAASLASTHESPKAPSPIATIHTVSEHCRMLPGSQNWRHWEPLGPGDFREQSMGWLELD